MALDNKQKLAFIGRKYHEKTKSDQTALELLKTKFDVTIFRREESTTRELISKVNRLKPSVVVYWCLPPSITHHLIKIRCKNHVWAPMWDGFRPLPWRKLIQFRLFRLKIVCFSEALYNYFQTTSLKCAYWKCFVKPNFTKTHKAKPPYTIFLWQREMKISIDNITTLIGEENIEKMIYKSEIGEQPHKNYSFEIEKLTDWLPLEEYTKTVLRADIFIAPRVSEGIGFSFIEPLSLGKMVFAYNNSTMNEYIIDAENGYLFDDTFTLKTSLKPPLELLPKMKMHADNFYSQWLETKESFAQFIMDGIR